MLLLILVVAIICAKSIISYFSFDTYKSNSGNFNSEHVNMADGTPDDTTIDFVCDIINISHNFILNLNSNTLLANYGICQG